MRYNIPNEHQEQMCLFNWVGMATFKHPELSLMFAIPNGGLRNKVTAMKLKAEGVKSGVSDIFLPVARQGFHGLFIEMKRIKGGKESENQSQFRKNMTEQGYKAVVCKGWLEAKKELESYLS